MSGYVDCACPNCFEIAIEGGAKDVTLCWECEEAECDVNEDCLVDRDKEITQ